MAATIHASSPPQRLLVLSQCAFGDTLVLIPALRALRRAWPKAYTVFISEPGNAGQKVSAAAVLAGTDLVDQFECLSTPPSRLRRGLNRLRLLLLLRRHSWDLGIVLLPPVPPLTVPLIQRLSSYLRLFGARHILAPDRVLAFSRDPAGWLNPLPHVSDTLLDLLRQHGVPSEGVSESPMLPPVRDTGNTAHAIANALLCEPRQQRPSTAVRLAIAPGAQMPSKRWPIERYADLLGRLHADCAPRFVFLGGNADREVCEQLSRCSVDAVCVIGQPIPAVIEVMRRCDAYVGNDTGLMHTAAALAKPCVAVFGSRDAPGAWYPYGSGHTVFRSRIACEGCLAAVCPRGDNACLQQISVESVHRACLQLCTSIQAARAHTPNSG